VNEGRIDIKGAECPPARPPDSDQTRRLPTLFPWPFTVVHGIWPTIDVRSCYPQPALGAHCEGWILEPEASRDGEGLAAGLATNELG